MVEFKSFCGTGTRVPYKPRTAEKEGKGYATCGEKEIAVLYHKKVKEKKRPIIITSPPFFLPSFRFSFGLL